MGSVYYTEFTYRASGLDSILKQFRSAANEIETTSKKIGKINFVVNDAQLKQAAASAQVLNRELSKISTIGTTKISADFGRLEVITPNFFIFCFARVV